MFPLKMKSSQKLIRLLPLGVPMVIASGLFWTAACTNIPDLDRPGFSMMSASQEAQLGYSEFQRIKQQKKISTNADYNARVQRVARRLVPHVPIAGADWEFVVFEDPTPNAFALPGGKVGIHTGLFQVARNDAQLAAVIGHELGHVVARHAGERRTAQTAAALGGVALGVGLGQSDMSNTQRAAILGGYGAAATVGGILPFSRRQELEADQMGAIYMARAGYDPRESVQVWINFMKYREAQGGARPPQFLSTHPLDESRIANLERFMPRALAEMPG